MPIPEHELHDLKQKIDIVQLFADYGHQTEKKGKDFFTCCPFHSDEDASLSINREMGVFHCMACNAKGNSIQLVQKMENISFLAAYEKLKQKDGSAIQIITLTKMQPNPELLHNSFMKMQKYFQELPDGIEYLKVKRKINHIEQVEIGYCPADFGNKLSQSEKDELKTIGVLTDNNKPRFKDCVIFPLKDAYGKITSLYGRKAKGYGSHFYLPGERSGTYGYYREDNGEVYLTESIIDAISLMDIGIANVLSLYGVNGWTAQHENWLKHNHIHTVYLMLDGDQTGREAADKLKRQLKEKNYICYDIALPKDEDPNSYFCVKGKTLSELRELPGYPKLKSHTQTGNWDGDRFITQSNKMEYHVLGLTAMNLDKLRITLKVFLKSDPNVFHMDSLDLYSARQRNNLVEELKQELGLPESILRDEIKILMTALETERMKICDNKSEQSKPQLNNAEKNEALQELKNPNLIKNLLRDFEMCGMIGEEKGKLVGYLGSISRFLPKPIGMLIISRFGAGKTTLQNAICDFVPEEDLIKYSRLTGQALYYKGKDSLKHKVLAIEEEEGMSQALYSVKLLQSDQRLSSGTTRSDPKSGRLVTDDYSVEGPVFIMIATTNPEALDNETKSRFVIATIDCSREQNERILEYRKRLSVKEGRQLRQYKKQITHKHQNMQRLLRPIRVENDLKPFLDYPSDVLQTRREWEKYETLMSASAILRQYQKPIKKDEDGEYIEVDVHDVALANELVMEFFPNSMDELAPHSRQLGGEISSLVESKGGEAEFTRKELREYSGWTDWSIRQGLKQLEDLGYIVRTTGQNGVLMRYEMVVDVKAEERKRPALTDVVELKKRVKSARTLR